MLTEEHQRSQTFSWVSPREVLRHASTLSGLEVMQAVASGELPPPPIAVLMQFAPVEVSDGKVVFECTPSEAHYNPIGTVHGGLACTFLDTLVGCAAHTTLPAGVGYTSLDLMTRFIKPVTTKSGLLRCEGTIISRGRRTAVAESRLFDERGTLLAQATSTCLIFEVPQA